MGESPRAMECFSDNPNRGTADKIGKNGFFALSAYGNSGIDRTITTAEKMSQPARNCRDQGGMSDLLRGQRQHRAKDAAAGK